MANFPLKKHIYEVLKGFSITDRLFLALRLWTILGSSIWLIFAPLSHSVATQYSLSLAIFSLYSLILYILIFFKPNQIRHVYIVSLLLDLLFIFYLVHLEPEYRSSFFLCYYLLVLLHTLYFGHVFGLMVATLSASLYLVNLLPYWNSVHWTEIGIRIVFLYLIGFPAGIIHGKLKKDKKNIEELNEQLAESLDSLQAMQTKLVEKEKLSALGRLTETVAHEIRNPLMSLGGFSRRLQKLLPEDSKEKQYAETIVTEVARLESILRDVLLFTAEKKGLARGDLNPVVRDAAAYFLDLYSNGQHYEVIENYQPELYRIYLDPEQLRQAVGNLISNSIDAMPEGGTLTITTENVEFNQITGVAITIKDTGKGMSKKQSELILEPFYSTKRVGTGLGLAIVHEIMEEHRGFIRADSSEEKGTTFSLFFPYQPEEEDSKTQCWQCIGCGIETDPSRRCPAYPYFGRICWAIAGTMCEGKVMGTYADKIHDCHQCPFFKRCQNPEDPRLPTCLAAED